MKSTNSIAALALNLSKDKMMLSAEIQRFSPNHQITFEDVIIAVKEEKISTELVDQKAIKALLQTGDSTVIAQGRPAEHGRDASFTETFFFDEGLSPNIDTHDVAHYYQTKRYITVDEGDIVMKRTPASETVDGLTLLGKSLKAKKGKDKGFKKHPGTTICPENENHLVASIHGHPVVQTQGVKIDQTLTLRNADLKSGNINYDGSVVINGDVQPLVSIAATGDVFIKGTVENATIEAGNNIIIGGGVISESVPGNTVPPKLNTKLKAGGEIHAKFLTQAEAKATGDIKVKSAVLNSRLVTQGSVVVGESGGKGAIMGGSILAGQSVTANELGSIAYVATEVTCGDVAEIRIKLSSTSSLLHRRLNERQQLKEILKRIKPEPAPCIGEIAINRRTKINAAIKNLDKVLRQLRSTHSQLKADLEVADTAFILANKKLYPQVAVQLNGEHYSTSEERGRTKITSLEGKLNIE